MAFTDQDREKLDAIYSALFVASPARPSTAIVHQLTQTEDVVNRLWDGYPGDIVDAPGVLARTLKNIAAKVGAKVG